VAKRRQEGREGSQQAPHESSSYRVRKPGHPRAAVATNRVVAIAVAARRDEAKPPLTIFDDLTGRGGGMDNSERPVSDLRRCYRATRATHLNH